MPILKYCSTIFRIKTIAMGMLMNAMLMGIHLGLINVMKIMSRMKKKSLIYKYYFSLLLKRNLTYTCSWFTHKHRAIFC